MGRTIKVLVAEDNPADAELVVRQLRKAGFEPDWRRVDTEAEFVEQLRAGCDLVLSDYQMPQFSALRALARRQEIAPDVPFIIISGTIGEETAVEAMKHGATDYLLKDRLARLGLATNHALEQADLRRESLKSAFALAESERRYRLMFESNPQPMWVFDRETLRFLAVNDSALAQYGYTREEFLAMTIRDIRPAEELPLLEADLAQARLALARPRPWLPRVWLHRRKDGSLLHVLISSHNLPFGDRLATLIMAHDETARAVAEAELRASEERFRQLAENIHEVFWMTDPAKHLMLYVSPGYERVWGRTCDSLYESPQNWAEGIHPDDRERVLSAMASRQEQGDYDETYRIVRPDGTLRWIHDRAFPVRDATGAVYRIVGVAQDVTEQKQLEAQFFRAQRLESVGFLATGIAHDLNNILAPIMMSAPMIRTSKSVADTERMLTMIESSAQRGAKLIRQLLTFGKGIGGDRKGLSVASLLEEMESIVRQTFPRKITIVTQVESAIWPILGDATQIHQVLLNLCVNARDAMSDGGRLTLAAENVQLDRHGVGQQLAPKTGRFVRLTVTDTGIGMSPEVIDKIFDPFFTTKASGEGTGLGLPTTLGIVKSHGGFMTLTSEPGRGTTFLVYLPADLPADPRPAPESPEAAPGRTGYGQLVLVVDDEASIRETLAGTLVQHGYRVIVARDGLDGIACFAKDSHEIALVITDLDMPNMDGAAMIKILRRINPMLRVILSSGVTSSHPFAVRTRELPQLGAFAMLRKPYTADRLLAAVQAQFAPAPSD